jgi:hypothetical protein
MIYSVGESFHLPEEGISGTITNIETTAADGQVALVIACHDGQWAMVDLSKVQHVTVH